MLDKTPGTIIRAVVFDWGDTLMRDLGYPGPMLHWPKVELVPGAEEALGHLHRRLICCVASNAGDSDAELMTQALERVGLRHYLQHFWTSRELGVAKPNPGFFQAALKHLRLAPEYCLAVGNDYQKDIVPAREVGLWTAWLAPRSAGAAPAADLVLASLSELPSAIARLAAD